MKQIDKVYHFVACMVIMIVFAKWVFPFPLAVLAAIAVAFGKEMYDRAKYRHFCWYDIIADGLGIVTGSLIAAFVTGVGNWGV